MSVSPSDGRSPWVAVVLSLLSTGLGHIYCGRIVTGLVLFLASLLFAPLAVLAALLPPSTAVLAALLLSCLAVLAVYGFAVADAFRVARREQVAYTLKDYNRGIVYALFILVGVTYPVGIVHYLRANVFEAFLVPNASEAPNILSGDRILVNKLILRGRIPRRGEMIVFRHPSDRRTTWVKRVIALPGDTVAVQSGQVFVNGKKLERDREPSESLPPSGGQIDGTIYSEANAGHRYLVMESRGAEVKSDYKETKIPDGSVFVLGDNRNRTQDSRDFGPVPLGNVIGMVQYVYLPAGSWGRFGTLPE